MGTQKLRRQLKRRLQHSRQLKFSGKPVVLTAFVSFAIVLVLFCVVQLTIVTILGPQGETLKMYNTEKDLLVEENRILEEKIAERTALHVVTSRAKDDLGMERVESVMYFDKTMVSADAAVTE